MLLSRAHIFCLVFALTILQTHQDCINLCYNRQSGKGQCDICYYECSHSSEAYFTSCHYENQETGQIMDLSETQCYSFCYPEMLHQLKTLEEVSEKLNIEEGIPIKISSSLHQVSTGELQKQLQEDEHDMDIIIFALASGCAFFTILAIMLIIRCFESKDESKRTIDTKYYENQEKDLPDINVESSSSYYETNSEGNGTKKLTL